MSIHQVQTEPVSIKTTIEVSRLNWMSELVIYQLFINYITQEIPTHKIDIQGPLFSQFYLSNLFFSQMTEIYNFPFVAFV